MNYRPSLIKIYYFYCRERSKVKKTIITLSLLVSFASASSFEMCKYYIEQSTISHKKVNLYLKNNMTYNICLYIDFALTDKFDAIANCDRVKGVESLVVSMEESITVLNATKETYCGGVK